MKKRTLIGVGLLVPVIAIQLVPVDRTNPPVAQEIDAPADALAVLRRSCYDCHSNETAWPWYSSIAPMSWFVANHVHDGRKHLNFSEWDAVSTGTKPHLMGEIWEEVAEGEMPLTSYLVLHGSARLTDADREALRAWAMASGAVLGGEHDDDQD